MKEVKHCDEGFIQCESGKTAAGSDNNANDDQQHPIDPLPGEWMSCRSHEFQSLEPIGTSRWFFRPILPGRFLIYDLIGIYDLDP